MANTYTLINSTSLSTTAASVTFSAIPATYDDLVVSVNARCDVASISQGLRLTANISTASNNSFTLIQGDGSSAVSSNAASASFITIGNINGTTSTTNTFQNLEIYIPSYRVSQKKPLSGFNVLENNATEAYIRATAALIDSTSAITSLTLEVASSGNFVSGSTFWLYGIKNS